MYVKGANIKQASRCGAEEGSRQRWRYDEVIITAPFKPPLSRSGASTDLSGREVMRGRYRLKTQQRHRDAAVMIIRHKTVFFLDMCDICIIYIYYVSLS